MVAALAALALAVVAAGCAAPEPAAIGDPGARRGADSLTALRAGAALRPCPLTAAAAPAAGQPGLPDVELPCLGGGAPVALRRLAGPPTVLNLWASWCGPCREELPAFERLRVRAGDRLRVLGVVTEDPPESALSLAAALGVHLASVLDEDGAVKQALGRSLLPSTVLVDRGGRIVQVYTGPPLSYDDLRALVRDRLGVAVP